MAVNLETRVRRTAQQLLKKMEGAKPALFRADTWVGKAVGHCLSSDAFRTAFLRFLDVFPHLGTPQALSRHVQEYFGPSEVRPQAESLGITIADPDSTAAMDTASVLAVHLKRLAGTFIGGADFAEAAPVLSGLRSAGAAISAGLLGEAVISEREADACSERVVELLACLAGLAESWPPLGSGTLNLDWGNAPKVNVSVKASTLYSQFRAVAFEHSVEKAKARLRAIYGKAVKSGATVVLDMEHRELKNLTLALYKSLSVEPELLEYPHTGLVVQSCLKESDRDLDELLSWARNHHQRFTVRLVKGAYWDAERVWAAQRGWPAAVYLDKGGTDLAFERLARRLLENQPFLSFACASHNVRSIAWVLENARELKVPNDRLEFQLLYGMADPLFSVLLQEGLRVRVYVPIGGQLAGTGYLLRRFLEATGAQSFQRKAFQSYELTDGPAPADLVRAPQEPTAPSGSPPAVQPRPGPFRAEPVRDWTLAESRTRFAAALQAVREKMPYRVGLAAGKVSAHRREIVSENPNRPKQIVGWAPNARRREVLAGVAAAMEAFPDWRDTEPAARAELLLAAAAAARERRDELAALEVLEAGRSWEEADADVCEAVDYLEYYARQMIRLGRGIELGVAGEPSRLLYSPRGVAAVIAPWNSPLAVPLGMTAAALVAGNTVVLKPSSRTPVTGSMVPELFAQAGLPAGVLSFLTAAGEKGGELLVSHPGVSLVAFCGTRETGLRVLERAGKHAPHAAELRAVVIGMGGKNAVIVDADADLDEAVGHVVRSAFGFQGQKCSACSRVLVLEEVYARFLERLKAAVESLELGPVEDPRSAAGAVIDETARERVKRYIDAGRREGKVLLLRKAPAGPGYTVPLAIFHDVKPRARIAHEEILGPVLSVIKVKSFGRALELANDSAYALCGGVFSRSPVNLRRAERELRVGSLYLNRGITDAAVGRHPFGGFRMSGPGIKSGGPDYLLHFLLPRCVAENALRRGYAPD